MYSFLGTCIIGFNQRDAGSFKYRILKFGYMAILSFFEMKTIRFRSHIGDDQRGNTLRRSNYLRAAGKENSVLFLEFIFSIP